MTSTSSAAVATHSAPPPRSALAAALTRPALHALYLQAFDIVRHVEDAKDLTQTTIRAALERDGAGTGWKGEPPPLKWFLGSVLNGEVSNKRRTDARWRKIVVPTEAEPENAPGETPGAEEALLAHAADEEKVRTQATLKSSVRAYFASVDNGRIPLALMDAAASGMKGRKKLAEHIQCSVEELDEARKRIQHHTKRIVEQHAAGGARS